MLDRSDTVALIVCRAQIELGRLSPKMAAAVYDACNQPGGGNPVGEIIAAAIREALATR